MTDKTESELYRQLLARIGRLSASYVPEWRFSPDQSDLGSALAMLFAEMMEDAAAAREQVMERYRILFFQSLGAEQRAAGMAEGYMTFDLEADDLPEAVVPAESLVTGDGPGGAECTFQTLEDIYVSAADVSPVKVVDDMWFLKFTRPPKEGLLSLLFLMKGDSEGGGQALEWTYYGSGGFSPLQVLDETGSLRRTGLVRFSGSPDFEELELDGDTGWWIRICSAEHSGAGMPPLPDGVYLNAGKVRAIDPGEESNLPAGTELELGSTVGFVSRITNPDILCGGSGEETVESCLRRCSAALRHGGRAVSPGDLECLAAEVSGDIERVQCFGGRCKSGERQPGAVTLVVLSRDYRDGGRYFYRLREQIRERLESRVSQVLAAGNRLEITAPWFVRIDVSARLYVEDYSRVIPAKLEAEKLLEQYLDPVAGGYDGHGWEFGSIPGHEQLSHMLQRLDGVRYVRQVCLTVWLNRGEREEEAEWETVSRLPWVLPVSGEHRIQIVVAE